MTLQAGDVVRLRSGGPPMTIEYIDGPTALCAWFVGEEIRYEKFYLAGLDKVEPWPPAE